MSKSVSIENLTAHAENVLLPMGLLVSSIEITGAGAVFGTKPPGLTGGKVGLTARVLEQPLAQFVQSKVPSQVRDVQVFLGDGLIKVTAKAVVILPISFTAYCRLEVANGSDLNLVLEEVHPGGPVRSFLEKEIEEMNPLLTGSDLPVPVTLTDVTIDDGAIVLNGELLPVT